MSKLRILMTNEPLAYRDSLATIFKILRPDAEVLASPPEDQDLKVETFSPHLVVCSRLTRKVRDRAISWVELYPQHQSVSYVNVGGRCSAVGEIDLPQLLHVVDQTETIVEA